jgi:tRNA (mo5U34)-methyltransferase
MSSLSPATSLEFRDRIQQQVDALAKKSCYHSLELLDGTIIPGMIPVAASRARIQSFPIPEDLHGKRVLDVGAASGWNSFEMERRGAEVVAVDCVEYEEFHMVHKLRGSNVDYRILDMDELTPATLGRFDYVLFFGVLYHLRHPLLALERICALTREAAFVESFVTDDSIDPNGACTLEFYETDELGGQIDNWFGPNTKCLLAMCRAAGFARVEWQHNTDRRCGVACYRKWEPASPNPSALAPRIHSAVNNRTNDIYFSPVKDEYICLYLNSSQLGLIKERLRVEIDGYGVPILAFADLGRQGWQANLKAPPFLDPGPHLVRVRTLDSAFSNEFEIVAGAPSAHKAPRTFAPFEDASEPPPAIYEVENNNTESNVFHGYKNEYLCVRFRARETGLDRNCVLVEVDGTATPVLFLSDLGEGAWQTNSRLPAGLTPGPHRIRVRTASSGFSNEVQILFQPES